MAALLRNFKQSLIDESPLSTAITFTVTKALSSEKSQKMAGATSVIQRSAVEDVSTNEGDALGRKMSI
ncbi:MAG: hypothetical protein NTY13_01975 [Chlamydiae bacterium]|nr:hypothetical protein [Chlamydiota bacterium]